MSTVTLKLEDHTLVELPIEAVKGSLTVEQIGALAIWCAMANSGHSSQDLLNQWMVKPEFNVPSKVLAQKGIVRVDLKKTGPQSASMKIHVDLTKI